jgi:hypothetical protein
MLNIYKITNAGPKEDGKDLLGLLIIQSSDGFYVIDPEPGLDMPRVLAHSEMVSTGQSPLLKFRFRHDKRDWEMDVDTVSAVQLNGTWHNPHPQNKPEKPDEPEVWVASGTGRGVPGEEPGDDGEEQARAATAQKRQ